MQNNYKRIKAARAALKTFKEVSGDIPDSLESDITGLITDLLHLANRASIDPQALTGRSLGHFLDEQAAREIAARKHGRSVKNILKFIAERERI